MTTSSPMLTRLEGPAPEVDVSRDIVRRGLLVAPVLVTAAGLIWGVEGVWSALYGVALILTNFAVSAGSIAITSRIGLGVLMGAVLFGFVARLGLIFLALHLVRDAGWISLPALGATIIITHLGLLVWELKFVALSLAHPGLKPAAPVSSPASDASDTADSSVRP